MNKRKVFYFQCDEVEVNFKEKSNRKEKIIVCVIFVFKRVWSFQVKEREREG